MKKKFSLIILFLSIISLSGCMSSEKSKSVKETTIIESLDSSDLFHDYLPDSQPVDSEELEIIEPE